MEEAAAAPKEEMEKTAAVEPERNVWNELISQSRGRSNKFDCRSKMVFDALREKLKKKTEAKGKSDIELQLEKSESHLEELIQFGNELVSNIKTATEEQELRHGQDKHAKEVELQQNLEQEAELSLAQFEEINAKWREMNEMKEPMAIYEEMQKQKENISNLMASKDELIKQCQLELQRMNQKYHQDQDKQSKDICFLVERIDRQIDLLKRTYKTSFEDLQNTIDKEKQRVLEQSKEKWDTVYEHLTVNEGKKIEKSKEKQKYYEEELEGIRRKQEEITRTTRIRLEKDAEVLELEIRKTRANILMNSEKIDYNYQVLQKRNEENIIINNQQKRRVTKFNESIGALRRKLSEQRANNKLATEKLYFDIAKLHESINALQIKAEHFRKNNRVMLTKVWDINFKEIKQMILRVYEIDRILYEQQLIRKWEPPNYDLDSYDLLKRASTPSPQSRKAFKSRPEISKIQTLSPDCHKQLQDILQKISDRAGFLVEKRLLEILRPYTDEEKCLVRIESIFTALNIKEISLVKSLIQYFEPYSWCPNCARGLSIEHLQSLYSFKRTPGKAGKTKAYEKSLAKKNPDCKNHNLFMEPTLVLTALNEFINSQLIKRDGKSEEQSKSLANTELDLFSFDKDQIVSYWGKFSSFMTKEQQNLWKSIEHGLNHYVEVLKKRLEIDSECVFLQNQNNELKHLLQKL